MPVLASDVQVVLNAIRVLAAVTVLGYAAYKDHKVREVKDEAWMVMEVLGLGLISAELLVTGASWLQYMFLIPIFTVLAYAFFGVPEPKKVLKGSIPDIAWCFVYALSVGILVAYMYMEVIKPDQLSYQTKMLLPILILTLIYYLMYYASFGGIHLLHGGADAKGMIAITVLLPVYPLMFGLPLMDRMFDTVLYFPHFEYFRFFTFFPFSLSVLMNAAFIPLLYYLIVFPVRNIARKDLGLPMFFGYKMPLDMIEKSHVWLMQRCDKKYNQRIVLFPAKLPNPKGDLRRLKEDGVEKAWVTPKVPFMIPILLGLIILIVFGNLLVEIMLRVMFGS